MPYNVPALRKLITDGEKDIAFELGLQKLPPVDAPRDKCAHFREINGIAAAFQHLQKNYNPIASSFL
ncbi:hypothetical protein ACRZF5_004417 [Citrobacter freundii]